METAYPGGTVPIPPVQPSPDVLMETAINGPWTPNLLPMHSMVEMAQFLASLIQEGGTMDLPLVVNPDTGIVVALCMNNEYGRRFADRIAALQCALVEPGSEAGHVR